jgi:hypothetical protein
LDVVLEGFSPTPAIPQIEEARPMLTALPIQTERRRLPENWHLGCVRKCAVDVSLRAQSGHPTFRYGSHAGA